MYTNLKELQDRAREIAATYTDYTVDTHSMTFLPNGQMAVTSPGTPAVVGQTNDYAFNQICRLLDIPAGWVGKPEHCPDELRVHLMNKLANTYRPKADTLVRMREDTIRAVLSSKYTKFDNTTFIDLVAQAVDTMGIEPRIHRTILGDDLKAYIVFPQVTFAPDPQHPEPHHGNGGLHPAMYISNSERGGGSARVVGAVYRSICSNGMIMGWHTNDNFEVRHIYKSSMAMGLLVAEGITAALKMSEEATKAFIAAQEVHIEKPHLGHIVNEWATSYGLTVEAKEDWLATITSELVQNGRQDDPRAFDVINAATYVAQTQRMEETETMERMAGDLLAHYVPVEGAVRVY